MCHKRAMDEFYRGVEALVDDVPQMIGNLVMQGGSYTTHGDYVGGAWVGGYAYYSMLTNV